MYTHTYTHHIYHIVSVASYTSDDLKKLQAAVNALKSPALGDSIELEPSAIGQFLLKDHVRSQSTPNIAELDLESDTPLEGPNRHSGIVPSPTVHSFPHYAVISASENYTPKSHTSINASSGMPMAVMSAQMRTRERSYTTPTALTVMATQSADEDGMEQKEKPLTVSQLDEGDMGDSQARTRKVEKLESTRNQPHVPKPDTSVLQLAQDLSEGSITFEGGQFRTTKQGCVEMGSESMCVVMGYIAFVTISMDPLHVFSWVPSSGKGGGIYFFCVSN